MKTTAMNPYRTRLYPLLLAAFVILIVQGLANAQAPQDEFRPLPAETRAEMDRQRARVAALVGRHLPGQSLKGTRADLAVLQGLIDLDVIPRDSGRDLQALGVVFGDVLANSVPGLAWYEVTDNYGTDPTLRYKTTALHVNALTMISKRIRAGEKVDVADLAERVASFVATEAPGYE